MDPSSPYGKELEIACLAVQRAALLTKNIIAAVDKGVIDKSDNTPVTIADFAAQALIISAIHHVFPSDTFVGEESASTLREDPQLRERVWELVSSTRLDDEDEGVFLAVPPTQEAMLDIIDLGGRGDGGSSGRVWVLDPVDGTAAFMRGQQYAVCLALIEDGQQKLGVLGCPNLKLDSKTSTTGPVHEDLVDKDGYGLMLSAIAGQGAFLRPLGRRAQLAPAQRIPARLRDATIDLSDIRFADCQAANSTDYDKHGIVASKLGAPWPPTTNLWSTQMRYVALAVGGCTAIIKIPRKKSYRSCLWDHAGGMLIAHEVGCTITDLHGNPVDCGLGRTLSGAYGLVVAPEKVHSQVLAVVQTVIEEGEQPGAA
jgi:3'(2'), 5'-bisphosphate nucleotidase